MNGKCFNRLNHKEEFTALKKMYISKIFSIKKQIVKKNITLVHANTLRLAVIVILVKRFWGLDFKMIYTKHRHTRVESFNGKMFSNFINKSIDNLIVVCNYEKSKLTNRGIRAEKIVPIANGVDLNQFEFDSRFLKGAPGINIGILARLSDEKNHMFFLDIIEELFRREPLADINVSIAGDGPEMKNIKKTIIKKGLQHKVKLVGNVCNPEGFLKDIDILLLTSKFEMFPMSVLEGMAVGCVTISMNVGGIRECVSHDYNGYLIEDYSKEKFCEVISDVIANREDNEKLVLNGRKYIETNFSIKEVVRRHEDLYEDMLNNKSL
ncbi:MAG: glycosyltransferase [Clostridiaceae bacterium]|nr:glycosyltransferase [Clostridiaceae bacterium]